MITGDKVQIFDVREKKIHGLDRICALDQYLILLMRF